MTTPPPEGPADDPAGSGGSSRWQGHGSQPSEQPSGQPSGQGYGEHGYSELGYGEQGHWQQAGPTQGGPPPQGYGPPVGYGYVVPEHPKATTAMILGIIGVALCQVLAPFALFIGKRTVREIDASGGRLGGRTQAQTGYVLGIIGTVLLGLSLLFLVGYLLVVLLMLGGAAYSG